MPGEGALASHVLERDAAPDEELAERFPETVVCEWAEPAGRKAVETGRHCCGSTLDSLVVALSRAPVGSLSAAALNAHS